MKIIEEISRCESFTNDYAGVMGITAEMQIVVDGEERYVYCMWITAAEDCLDYLVAKESVFDILNDKVEPEDGFDFEACCIAKEYDETYAEQFTKLERMLREKAVEEGIDYGYFSDEKEESMDEIMEEVTKWKYAVFTETDAHGNQDYPCASEDAAIELAKTIFQQEKTLGKVKKCQVCEVEIYVSEVSGFVYSIKQMIKDFAVEE